MNSCLFVLPFSVEWNFDLYINLVFSFGLLQMRDSYLILDEYVSLFLIHGICMLIYVCIQQ